MGEMTLNTNDGAAVQHGPSAEPLGRIVDWLVAALLVLGGLAVSAIGIAVYSTADRVWIAELVADGRIQSAELTNAELIAATYGLAWWGGLALGVTGLLLVVAGVAFLSFRTRSRARREEQYISTPDTTTNAIVGGAVTIVTSFVPLSPVLGGAVSGYLEGPDRTAGARAGAYAGIVAAAPLTLLFGLLAVAFVVLATELSIAGPMAIGLAGLFIGFLVVVAYLIGLSALGGFLGALFNERRADDVPA